MLYKRHTNCEMAKLKKKYLGDFLFGILAENPRQLQRQCTLRWYIAQPLTLLPSGALISPLPIIGRTSREVAGGAHTHTKHTTLTHLPIKTRLHQPKKTRMLHRVFARVCTCTAVLLAGDNRAAIDSPLISNDSSSPSSSRQPLATCPSASCFSGSTEASGCCVESTHRHTVPPAPLTNVRRSHCHCSAPCGLPI